jgi:hypothetical protein
MKKVMIFVSILLLVIGFAVSTKAALVDMGDGTIYDTDTRVRWLKDANYARTSGYDADGLMNWLKRSRAASLNAVAVLLV